MSVGDTVRRVHLVLGECSVYVIYSLQMYSTSMLLYATITNPHALLSLFKFMRQNI